MSQYTISPANPGRTEVETENSLADALVTAYQMSGNFKGTYIVAEYKNKEFMAITYVTAIL